MKKVVVKVEIQGDKEKQKAMKAVSSLTGVDSLSMDMKEKKMTVVGEVDPVKVISKLRKSFHAEIVSVGQAEENKKKEEGKDKKDDVKKEGEKKKSDAEHLVQYYNPQLTHQYTVHTGEENPNACVIS